MIEAIQKAYYLRAMNPSDTDVLVTLARELGLNESQFCCDLTSLEVQGTLDEQVAFAHSADIAGFPSLLLQCDGKALPIAINYKDYRPTLILIRQAVTRV